MSNHIQTLIYSSFCTMGTAILLPKDANIIGLVMLCLGITGIGNILADIARDIRKEK